MTSIIYISHFISCLIVFLKDPGIPEREYYKDTFRFESEEDKKNYQKCSTYNIIIPKYFKVVHCQKCQICVIRQHHHCPWTGKCIGKYNIKPFCFFGCFLFGYIISLFISFITCLIYVTDEKNN